MTIILKDKSSASVLRLNDGQRKVTFHGIKRIMVLPVGIDVTIDLLEKLYQGYKAS